MDKTDDKAIEENTRPNDDIQCDNQHDSAPEGLKIITGTENIRNALETLLCNHAINGTVNGNMITFEIDDDGNTDNGLSDGLTFKLDDLRNVVPHFIESLGSADAFYMLGEELGVDSGYCRLFGGTEEDGEELVASIKPYSGIKLIDSLEFPVSTYDGTLTFNGDEFVVWEEPERYGIGSGLSGTKTGRYIRVVGNLMKQSDVPQEVLDESVMATPKVNGRKCSHVTIALADDKYVLDTNIPQELSPDVDKLMLINARPAADPRSDCNIIVDAYSFKDGASPSMYDCLEELPNLCHIVMVGISSHMNGWAGDTSDVPLQMAAARHGINVIGDKGETAEYKRAESKRVSKEIVAAVSDGPIYINEHGVREFASSAMCEIDDIDGSDYKIRAIAACIEGGSDLFGEMFKTFSQVSDAVLEYINIDDGSDSNGDGNRLHLESDYEDFVATIDEVTGDMDDEDINAIKSELKIDNDEKIFIYDVDLSDMSGISLNGEDGGEYSEMIRNLEAQSKISVEDGEIYIDPEFAKQIAEEAWANDDDYVNEYESDPSEIGIIDNSGSARFTDDDNDGYGSLNYDDGITLWNGYVISVGHGLTGKALADTIAEAAGGTSECLSEDVLCDIYESCCYDDAQDWDESWEFNIREPRYHIQGETPQWFIDSVDLTNSFTNDGQIIDQEYTVGDLDDGICIVLKPTCINFRLLDGLLESLPRENDFERDTTCDWVFSKKITNKRNPANGMSYEIAIKHDKSLMKEHRDMLGDDIDSFCDCWSAYIGVADGPYPHTAKEARHRKMYPALSISVLIPYGYDRMAFNMDDCYDVLRVAVIEVIRRIRDDEIIYEDCDECDMAKDCPKSGTRHGEKDREAVKNACKPVIRHMLALRNQQDDFSKMLEEL